MIRIKFNGNNSSYSADFKTEGEAVVLIGKKFPKKMDKGFKVYRLNGDFLGDYSEYTECEPVEGGYAFRKEV